MLPEQAILSQKIHSQGAAKTVPFVLSRHIDLAIQDQMEIVLTGQLRITINSLGISLDVDLPVGVVRDVKPRVGARGSSNRLESIGSDTAGTLSIRRRKIGGNVVVHRRPFAGNP